MKRSPTGKIRRGTRAFRTLRAEALHHLGPDGWLIWACPICRQTVPTPSEITLDHYGSEVWLHDPGNKQGIEAQTIRENSRLICRSCNSTRGRGRSDKRVEQLRKQKMKQQTQSNKQTTKTTNTWRLEPKRKTNQ